MFWKINYPGQYLLGQNYPSLFFLKESYSRFYRIKKIEILKRRNSKKWGKCSEETGRYDRKIVKNHVKITGCIAPYLKVDEPVPKCNSSSRFKDYQFHYEIAGRLNYPKDCVRMSEIRTSSSRRQKLESLAEKYRFGISYPDEIKIISQSKEIDIHALIGNIGGYFGLFLGKNQKEVWQICRLLFILRLQTCFRKHI